VSGPYYCAMNNEIVATTSCMYKYENIDVKQLATHTNTFASSNLIDAPGNMSNDRVFILSGMNDSTVLQGLSHASI